MTFLDFGATLTGAGADAVWSFIAPSSGFYTIAVGGWDSIGCPARGSATGPYAYAITVTGNAPEPMTACASGHRHSRLRPHAPQEVEQQLSGGLTASEARAAAPSNRSFYVEEYYARTPIAL